MYICHFSFLFQHPHLGSRGRQCRGLSDDQRQVLQMFDPACDISRDGSCDKMAAYNRDTIGFFIAKYTKIKKWKWNTMLLSLLFFLTARFWKHWKFMLVSKILHHDNGSTLTLLCILTIFRVKNVWTSALNIPKLNFTFFKMVYWDYHEWILNCMNT